MIAQDLVSYIFNLNAVHGPRGLRRRDSADAAVPYR
jgi:hypothetical protein